jgi:hypothetical protein
MALDCQKQIYEIGSIKNPASDHNRINAVASQCGLFVKPLVELSTFGLIDQLLRKF